MKKYSYRFLTFLITLIFILNNLQIVFSQNNTILYDANTDFNKMLSNTKKLDLTQSLLSKKPMLFLSALGFFNSTAKTTIKPSDKLTKEEALSVILNAAGKEQDAFLRAEKLESQKTSGTKLVLPYNYLYLGYIQLAYDLKILSKQQYQDAMAQAKPSQKEHQQMTQQLIQKNAQIVAKAVYEQRPYSYDDLIFVRSAPATRQEVCYWVVSAFKVPVSYSNLASNYPDYDKIDSKFLSSVNTLLKNGSLTAREDGYLHPDDYITYEDLSNILYSFEDYILKANNIAKQNAVLAKIQKYQDKTVYLFEADNGQDIEVSTIPNKKDFVVITKDGAGLSSSLQAGDDVNLYLDSNSQLILSDIISKAGQSTIKGVINKIDLKNSKLQIKKPDGESLDIVFTPQTIFYDSRMDKNVTPKDLVLGNIVTVNFQKNRAKDVSILSPHISDVNKIKGLLTQITKDSITIKSDNGVKILLLSPDTEYINKSDFTKPLSQNDFYEGLKVLVGEYCGYVQYISTTYDDKAEDIVGGILYDIDTNLNYVEIYNQDGVKKSYRLSKKIGLKVTKAGKNATVDDLNQGDVVFLYFNGDFVRAISASDGTQEKLGIVQDIVRNTLSKKPEKLYLNINGKIYGPYSINSQIKVFKGSALGSVDDLATGQYVKVTGSFYGSYGDIKNIEISANEYIKNIYMAQATTLPNGSLYLSNISVFRNNKFESIYDFKTFKPSSDTTFIVDGKVQADVPTLQNSRVLVITKDSFSDETPSLVHVLTKGSLWTLNGEVVGISGNVITINGERYNITSNTYTVSSGLLSRNILKVGDEATIITDGKNVLLAKLQDKVSKPLIVRGEILQINELESIKLKNYVYLDRQEGWKYVNSPMIISYDTQTTFCNVYGLNNIKDIVNFQGKNIYAITDGKYAYAMIDAPFGGYIVVGTMGKNNIMPNAQYYDIITKTWNKISTDLKIDNSAVVYINKDGNIIEQPPQYGDEIIALVSQSDWNLSSNILKPAIIIINY